MNVATSRTRAVSRASGASSPAVTVLVPLPAVRKALHGVSGPAPEMIRGQRTATSPADRQREASTSDKITVPALQ